MGDIWLYDLPDIVAGAGLDHRSWHDWDTRARSSGGYDQLWAIFPHHTASNTHPDNDAGYMWDSTSGDQPIGAILLERTGRVTIGAAGATNCQGKGGPYATSRGTIPLDKGNAYGIAIEAANNGTGEPWPAAQQDAYVKLCAALCAAYGLDPTRDIIAHAEWAPDRKIDPAGPSAWASGAATWNMPEFRHDVDTAATPPAPDPDPAPLEDPMLIARDSTTNKLWIGNLIEKVSYSDADAGYAISMAAKTGTPLRDAGTGRPVTEVSQVTAVSDRYIRMMGTAPG